MKLSLSAALQHISCQEAALHFHYTLPMLFVLYLFYFMYIIVLCTYYACVPIHAHIGTEKGWVVPSGKTIVLPRLTCPRLVLGATYSSALFPALKVHCLWECTDQGRSPSDWHNIIHLCTTGEYFSFICRGCRHSNPFQKVLQCGHGDTWQHMLQSNHTE